MQMKDAPAPLQNYPQPWHPQQGRPQPPDGRKNPAVGIVSAAVVAVAAVLGNIAMVAMAAGKRISNSTSPYEQLGGNAAGIIGALNASFFLGFVAFVLGIVAISANRGRGLGLTALLVSITGPIISFGIYVAISA